MFNTGIVVWARKVLGIQPPPRPVVIPRVKVLPLDPTTLCIADTAIAWDYVDYEGGWWRCYTCAPETEDERGS